MSRPTPPARPLTASLLPAALLLLALAGCEKAPGPGTTTTPLAGTPGADAPAANASMDAAAAALAASEPPLPDLGDFRVVSVLMGKALDGEHVVLVDTREFTANDPIHASVLSIGAHQGLKLSADWLAPDGRSFAKTEQPVVPGSDLATTFTVKHPAGWPPGDYQLRVAINGHTVRTERFRIR